MVVGALPGGDKNRWRMSLPGKLRPKARRQPSPASTGSAPWRCRMTVLLRSLAETTTTSAAGHHHYLCCSPAAWPRRAARPPRALRAADCGSSGLAAAEKRRTWSRWRCRGGTADEAARSGSCSHARAVRCSDDWTLAGGWVVAQEMRRRRRSPVFLSRPSRYGLCGLWASRYCPYLCLS